MMLLAVGDVALPVGVGGGGLAALIFYFYRQEIRSGLG